MKKLTVCIMTALFTLIFVPGQLKAETGQASMAAVRSEEATEASVLITRLNLIDAMDKTEMSISEKQELKKEVRSIKGKLKELGGGIYLSFGLIIIILLLIILL